MDSKAKQMTFVVGTGRCGSTALSRVMHQHPDILSLNEFWSAIGSSRLQAAAGPMDGPKFLHVLAEPRPGLDALIRSEVDVPEFGYPAVGGRYSPETGIPAICLLPLPALTSDPDALFDELSAEIVRWPERSSTEQWMALFDWLRRRFGKKVAVERSGFSLRLVLILIAAFPNAKFIHLHRDGPSCAMSMSRHYAFRMLALQMEICDLVGLPRNMHEELTEEHAAQLPPHLAPLLSNKYDPELLNRPLEPARFGRIWSDSIVQGVSDLAPVATENRMNMSYEQLLADPHQELTRLADFLGVEPTSSWLTAAADGLHPPGSKADNGCPPEDLESLLDACAPGMALLGR